MTLTLGDSAFFRPDRDLYGFNYDSAIVYLSDARLLFTFNPHVLIPRSGAESKFSKLRVIRAELIDLPTRQVMKTVDWKVSDNRQYLWPVPNSRILVHVGKELRLYGQDLKVEQRFSLGGTLAFVRASPSSNYFAVGVIRERHSETVHRELEDAEAREPEEDVEVKILDGNLHPLASVIRSSRIPPPVLSDYGEIRIQRSGKHRWTIEEVGWDRQKRLVAAINSTCSPDATSFAPNLLFLVGCDHQGEGRWYRVLRPDGKPILKGWSSTVELERRVAGGPAGSFSIGIAQATKSLTPGSPFRPADLKSERISVYRAENGRRTFSIIVPTPLPTVQSYTLSPTGDQLAVLQQGQVVIYRMPPGSRESDSRR